MLLGNWGQILKTSTGKDEGFRMIIMMLLVIVMFFYGGHHMFDGVDKYFPALACPTSPEKPGKPDRNLPMINLILKILKYDIKSWKHW